MHPAALARTSPFSPSFATSSLKRPSTASLPFSPQDPLGIPVGASVGADEDVKSVGRHGPRCS